MILPLIYEFFCSIYTRDILPSKIFFKYYFAFSIARMYDVSINGVTERLTHHIFFASTVSYLFLIIIFEIVGTFRESCKESFEYFYL